MKIQNKGKVLAVAGVLGLAALGITIGTVAYFTDTDSATNTFTVGNVDIELIESYLHRTNAGQANTDANGALYWNTTDYPLDGAAGTAPEDSGNWANAYYTDETILANSDYNGSTAYADYLEEYGQNIVPGTHVKKMPYVLNTGTTDAYVRVRVLVPKVLDDGVIAASYYTGTAVSSGATTMATSEVTRDSVTYNQYAFTYVDPLEPEQLTFWNVWGTVGMSTSATSADIAALKTNGALTNDGEFNVIIEADAIQADGFADAAAAFTAFDAQN